LINGTYRTMGEVMDAQQLTLTLEVDGQIPKKNRWPDCLNECLVEAPSLEAFAAMRKHDRYATRDAEYRQSILESHRDQLKDHGIAWMSHYDSSTGSAISWRPDK